MQRPPHRPNSGPNASPVNPMPPFVVALFLLIAGVEIAFSAGARGLVGGPGAVGWRLEAVQAYAFSGDVFGWMLANGQYPKEHLIRFVTYLFVHGSFTQAAFAGVMLLALGKWVGEVFGALPTLAVFFGSGIFGALAFGVLTNDPVLIGAFPAVYGLIGAFTYLLWVKLAATGEHQGRAFSLIGMLMAIQLVFSVIFPNGSKDWVADLAGFAAGFAISLLVSPGSWHRIRGKLRRN
ncbi:MAG: rhomboid family intramembrane serine protease [Paracoccaceae bacterium]